MAFNPFTSFRKNQRFWMATVLILCMVTFVLCTGVGGDLSERILNLFRPREGQPLAKVNGRSVYSKELTDLKDQRNMINEFMKRACELVALSAAERATSDKLPPEQRQQLLPLLQAAKADMEKRALRSRYFDTGVKLDDLVDFMVWRTQADRLNIKLLPEHVLNLLGAEMLGELGGFSREMMFEVMRQLRPQSQRIVNDATIIKALGEEYRVRIAKLALEYSDPASMQRRLSQKFQLSEPEVRIPLSPAMLWDRFKADRSEFNVAIVPVAVEDFLGKVPEPTEADLKGLFNEYKTSKYDPASPTPGFEIPASTRAELIVGDPASPKFKQWSKTALILEATPPAWIPTSPLATLVTYVGGPLAFKARLEEIYESIQNPRAFSQQDFLASRRLRELYMTASWGEPGFNEALAYKFAGKYPEAIAGLVAGYAMPVDFSGLITPQIAYAGYGAAKHPREMQLALAEEVKARVPYYASIVGWGALDPGLTTAYVLDSLVKEKYFPLDAVAESLTAILERQQAHAWVHANMDTMRKKLNEAIGNRAKFERELKNSLEPLGLERRVTKDFHDKFSIDNAAELQPLRKSFEKDFDAINAIEGRNLAPETMLKEGDFHKLFFDGTEGFSVAGSTYRAKPWPPVVTARQMFTQRDSKKGPQQIDLFEKADTPILFWKTDDKIGKNPEALDLVKDRVEKAWKFLKARDNQALPKAKEIADAVISSEVGPDPVLQHQALSLGKSLIELKGLATLYTKEPFQKVSLGLLRLPEAGQRDYATFTLPKDTFVYPRDEMAKELLSLHDLKKPVEIGEPKLDEFNKALFEAGSKNLQNRRIVQILTNKPRSFYYVAAITLAPGPSAQEFHSVMRFAMEGQALNGIYRDYFFDHAYEQAGKRHREALMEQLKVQTDSKVLADEKDRERFDASEAV